MHTFRQKSGGLYLSDTYIQNSDREAVEGVFWDQSGQEAYRPTEIDRIYGQMATSQALTGPYLHARVHPFQNPDTLRRVQYLCEALATGFPYAVSGINYHKDYILGNKGFRWKVNLPGRTKQMRKREQACFEALEAWREDQEIYGMERESVFRAHAHGEGFLHCFPNPHGFMDVRWIQPSYIRQGYSTVPVEPGAEYQ